MAGVARYWQALTDGRVRCDLCPRHCTLRDGQRGFCVVREAAGGALALSAYGRTTGLCIDPVEKKPLYHFLPGAAVLSFGTIGCNLGCSFCQNWDISRAHVASCLVEEAAPDRIARAARDLDCAAVAFTYNEPVVWAEYVVDTAAACHDLGVRTVAVTNAYLAPGARRDFFRHIDAVNVDLKALSDSFYRRMCLGHLAPVLDTLVWLRQETSVWLEVTNLLVPGENDGAEDVDRLCTWVFDQLGPDVPLHFTAFHPDYRLLDRPPTPATALRRARDVARGRGMRYVYTGNVRDPAGGVTHCPTCGHAVVARDGFRITTWALEAGQCRECGTPVAGVFPPAPGDWGPRCVRVSLRGVA